MTLNLLTTAQVAELLHFDASTILGTFGPRLGHGMIELVAVGGWVVAAVSAGLIVICLATGRGR